MWRDVEAAPLWQEQISQRHKNRWQHHFALGDALRRQNHRVGFRDSRRRAWPRIAWRSIGGESENAGEVIFEAAAAIAAHMVTVLQEFRMGKLASAWETIVGRNPKQAVIENLRHFKALAETGEIPRTQGQPHGPRGTIGGMQSIDVRRETFNNAARLRISDAKRKLINAERRTNGDNYESSLLDGNEQSRNAHRRRPDAPQSRTTPSSKSPAPRSADRTFISSTASSPPWKRATSSATNSWASSRKSARK